MNEQPNKYYDNGLKRSSGFKLLMAIVFLVMFVAPLALLFLFFQLSGDLAKVDAEAVGLLKIFIVLVAVIGILMSAAVIATLFRQMTTSLVVSEQGLLYKGILGKVFIRWKEIDWIEKYKAGRRPPVVKLHLKDGKDFTLDPFLVEQGENAPSVSLSFGGEPQWIFPDGEKLPMTFEKSAGYKAIKSFRPKFIEKMKTNDDYNLTV